MEGGFGFSDECVAGAGAFGMSVLLKYCQGKEAWLLASRSNCSPVWGSSRSLDLSEVSEGA